MPLEHLTARIEKVRAEADNTANAAARRSKEIDADPTLSDEGKRREHEANRTAAKERIAQHRAQEEQLLDDEIRALESRLDAFVGYSSADIIAFRDAQDRADRIEDAQAAAAMLARAGRTNDRTLAHAVFRRAMDAGWRDVTAAFERENPAMAGVAKDLTRLKAARTEGKLERSMRYGLSVWGI